MWALPKDRAILVLILQLLGKTIGIFVSEHEFDIGGDSKGDNGADEAEIYKEYSTAGAGFFAVFEKALLFGIFKHDYVKIEDQHKRGHGQMDENCGIYLQRAFQINDEWND